nr:MAG: hypothetical protein [Aspergillus flavus vivivirus 1]
MAGRHYFPVLAKEDIGPEPEEVLPALSELPLVRYKAGMEAATLVKQFAGKSRVALEAPPCSRKSVDVPAAILRGGLRPMVVHCVPSRLLAVATHDYVSTIHKDVKTRLVEDYHGFDSFPEDGLVYTSTSIMCAYMVAWRARGIEKDFVLFLDEMHESDFCTFALRKFQTLAPGVSVYVEATATRGAGLGGFAKSDLPAPVQTYNYTRRRAMDWDLYQRGTPWSLAKVTGDFLIFEDDPSEAKIICSKFREAGVSAYRLTAKTSVEDFRRVMREMAVPVDQRVILAVVVDYSFRSGFTFPTVSRIIDSAQVRFMQMQGGRISYHMRDLYAAEYHQSRNRGGRVAGQPCDYWVPNIAQDTITVSLEGAEADLACLLFRMLGRAPNRELQGMLFQKGKVPDQLHRIMGGEQPVRAYQLSCDWPGEDRTPRTPPMQSPLQPDFPETPASAAGDRASVFTVEDDLSSLTGNISAEQYEKAKARRSQVRARPPPEPELDRAPPIPRLRLDTADKFNEAFATLTAGAGGMEYGTYYYASGLNVSQCRFYRSFDEVLEDMGDTAPNIFLRSARDGALHDICALVLAQYNESVAVATAANHVMGYAARSYAIRNASTPELLASWANDVQRDFRRADRTARVAFDILKVCDAYKFKVTGAERSEAVMVERFLGNLSVIMQDQAQEREYHETLPAIDYNPSGRYKLSIQPNGWRTKLAIACLGDQFGEVDLAAVPDDSGGGDRVFTTASQLARASNVGYY